MPEHQRDHSFLPPPDAERIKRAVGSVKTAPPATPVSAAAADPQLDALRLSLAVRGAINPRALIPRSLPETTQLMYFDRLSTDCENVSAGDEPAWMLKDNVRRAVLQSHDVKTIGDALRAVPPSEADSITEALRAVYLEQRPELTTLSARSLRTLALAGEWSKGNAPFSVDTAEVRRHAARASKTEEYQRILANGFFGRKGEFDEAYRFFAAPLSQGLHHAWIWGAGGVGKSTLIAAVALECLKVDTEAPLVHLDFDRTDLDPARSVNLDLELLRQIGGASADAAPAASSATISPSAIRPADSRPVSKSRFRARSRHSLVRWTGCATLASRCC